MLITRTAGSGRPVGSAITRGRRALLAEVASGDHPGAAAVGGRATHGVEDAGSARGAPRRRKSSSGGAPGRRSVLFVVLNVNGLAWKAEHVTLFAAALPA